MDTSSKRNQLLPLFSILQLSAIAFYWLGYLTVRSDFGQVILLFSGLFIAYLFVYKKFAFHYFRMLVFAGILFRIVLCFSTPNLSDDVYRFIWDGRLAANGINPFSYLPSAVVEMQLPGLDAGLFSQLNSPGYFTIYPPVLQSMFLAGAKLFPANVYANIIFFKVVLLLFELGNLYLLVQLLQQLNKPKHLALLYFINPLVVIELTGNVHFESILLFFMLLSFLLLLKDNWAFSAIPLALGIATKLLPVLLIPLIVSRLGWKKGLIYAAMTGGVTLVLFAVFFDVATVQNLSASVDLFFQKFEFNASLYFIVRWIGKIIKGYNIIQVAGPVLSLLAGVIIVFISLRKKVVTRERFFMLALFTLSIWFLFATTVHPWYITVLVGLAVLTPYRFAILWSFTATFSYAAYQTNPVKELLWLVAVGYLFVLGYFVWELVMLRTVSPVIVDEANNNN